MINIQLPSDIKKILVSFSGGTDSLLALFLIIEYIKKYRPDLQIACVHGHDIKDCVESLHNVDLILNALKEKYNIELPMHIFTYEGVENKIVIHEKHINRIMAENEYQMIVYGSSANPPREIMKSLYTDEIGRNTKRVNRDKERRLKERTLSKNNSQYNYRPLLQLDKKEISEISKQNEFLWDLQKYTRSCDKTINGQPCKNCYACAEKKWAFGYYDGELV